MVRRIRKYFIGLIISILLCSILFGAFLFTSSMRSVYLEQMNQANINTVEQISSSFDLVLWHISEQANRYMIYDNDLGKLARDRNKTVLNYIKLYDYLRQIVIGNPYVYSVYLYSAEDDTFFDSKRGNSYTSAHFHDDTVIPALRSKSKVEAAPRLVKGDALIYSIIVPLKSDGSGQDYALSFNIDIDLLYKDVMKWNTGDSEIQLYIYDQDSSITVAKDHAELLHSIDDKHIETMQSSNYRGLLSLLNDKVGIMEAKTLSPTLNSYFYIQVPYNFDMNKMFDDYFSLFILVITIILVMIIAYVIVYRATKPIKEVMTDYQDKLMKDFLTGTGSKPDQALQMKSIFDLHFRYPNYSLWVIDALDQDTDLYNLVAESVEQLSIPDKLIMKAVAISSGRVAVIVNSLRVPTTDTSKNVPLQKLHKQLTQHVSDQVYITVSGDLANAEILSLAYMECDEMQQHKLFMPNYILDYQTFLASNESIPYPVEIEKMLINTLLAGKEEESINYTNEFLDHIFSNGLLKDIQARNYIYQLQNEIIARISSLRITIKPISSGDIEAAHSTTDLSGLLHDFVQSICLEFHRRETEKENRYNRAVIEYINTNFMNNNFNLNSLSDLFKINRNNLAKLIREETGYSFNDYVNMMKINLAKELLTTTPLTVEEISNRTGFTYAHYFIKVFKNIEGVTPGQYRDSSGLITENPYE